MEILLFLAHFAEAFFTLASGLVGVFLCLLMFLVGWVDRKHKPIQSKILCIGGLCLIVVWLWIQISLQVLGAWNTLP